MATNENTETQLSPVHEELLNLGESIRNWQLAQDPKLSDEALRSRFPELGSTRTYKRIHTGDGIESLEGDEWLRNYQEVWKKICAAEFVRSEEPVYDDLSPTVSARAAVAALMKEAGNQRLVIIEGDTGTGKTVALRAIKEKYGNTAYLVESHEGWSSLTTALKSFAEGVRISPGSEDKTPASAGEWIELIIKTARARGRRIVLLDECQHWNIEMLNALKTLINRTNWVFVVAAIDTLWNKMTRARYAESKQLTLNRLLKRVKLEGPTYNDAVKLIERRSGLRASKEKVNRMLELAETRGDFAFVRRVVAALNAQKDEVRNNPADDRISEAVALVLSDLAAD